MEYQIYNNGKVTRIELATSEISSGGQVGFSKYKIHGSFMAIVQKFTKMPSMQVQIVKRLNTWL